MKVRTIRTHFSGHGDSYEKSGSSGIMYDVHDEREADRLIEMGYVESADGGTARPTAQTAKPKSRPQAEENSL